MASGFFKAKTTNDYIYGTVNWVSTLNSVDNTSSVTASMTLRKYYHEPDSVLGTSGTGTWTLFINDVPHTITDSKSFIFDADTIVISNTITVPHNEDGTKVCSIRVTGGILGSSYTSTDADGTATLDTNIVQATILTAPDFTDLENPTITFSNPKNYPVQFKIEDTTGYNNLIVTEKFVDYEEESYTFNLTTEQRDLLRATAQDSSYFPIRFTICTYIPADSVNPTHFSWLDRSMHVTAGTPVFTNFNHEDSNPETVDITGDSSKYIQHYSNFRVYVTNANKMIAQKDAIGKGYSLIIGETSDYQPYTDTLDVVFAEKTPELLIYNIRVTAFDSRGKYTIVDKPVTMYPYDKSKNTVKINAFRPGGFGNSITVNINGTYNPVVVGGLNKNSITAIVKYRIVGSSDPWIKQEYDVYSGSDGIFEDRRTFLVDSYDYELQATVTDSFNIIGNTYETKLYSYPIFYVDDERKIGINMVPDGSKTGLYLEDSDVFYERFKTYFDTYLYNGLYNKIADQLYPIGNVFITDYSLPDGVAINLPGTWILDYHIIYDDVTPVAYLHKRTG